MMDVKSYLAKHLVRSNEHYTEYDCVKACVIGSMDGSTTVFGAMTFFRNGMTVAEYYQRRNEIDDWTDIPFLNLEYIRNKDNLNRS